MVSSSGYFWDAFGVQNKVNMGDALNVRVSSEQRKALLNVLFTSAWYRSVQMDQAKPFSLSPQQCSMLCILREGRDRMPSRVSSNDRSGTSTGCWMPFAVEQEAVPGRLLVQAP